MPLRLSYRVLGLCLVVLLAAVAPAKAQVISFSNSDFAISPVFSDVQTFAFTINLNVPLSLGTTYVNPALNGVVYQVFGVLVPGTPSGFPAFNLMRNIGGAEFYSQGSSLSFTIAPTADLSDGLQVSELVGVGPVFVFNGREVGTGRFHPALLVLNSDGTGSIRNSNNVPAGTEIAQGSEYISNLTFNPSLLTIGAVAAVPEPGALSLSLAALAMLALRGGWRARGRFSKASRPLNPT